MEKIWNCISEEALEGIAKELIHDFPSEKKFAFYGPMGAGKTTFSKAICKVLGVGDVVSSPTFSIVNEYLSERKEAVYHFDFYRIEEEQEAYDMGYEDYFYSDSYCLVEWPEKIEKLLPDTFVSIQITLEEEGERIIKLITND